MIEQCLQLSLDGLQVRLALKAHPHYAIPIDEVGQWQSHHTAVLLAQFRVAHRYWILRIQPGYKLPNRRSIVVHRNADHLQSLRCVLPLPRTECRHLNQTRRAPRCPKVQQNNLAVQTLQINSVPIEVNAVNLWCMFVNDRAHPWRCSETDWRDGNGWQQTGEKKNPHQPHTSAMPSARLSGRAQRDTPFQPSRCQSY